jgi:hypothetical protein
MEVVTGEFTPGQGWIAPANRKLTSMLSLNTLLNKGKTNAYFAGFIHDIGKLALAEVASYAYYSALREAIDKQTSLHEQERRFLGIDHAEAGELWLSWNGIDSGVRQSTAGHHSLNKKSGLLGSIVAVANQMVKIYGMGYSGSPVVDQRNLWETRAWAEVKSSCKNDGITPALMEEHFLPIVGQLPLVEPLSR